MTGIPYEQIKLIQMVGGLVTKNPALLPMLRREGESFDNPFESVAIRTKACKHHFRGSCIKGKRHLDD